MRPCQHRGRKPPRGYALMIVMVLMAISVYVLASAMRSTATSARLNDRHNRYTQCQAAAEAVTEMVVGRMARDFQQQGVTADLAAYRSLTDAGGRAWTSDYLFSDGQGNANQAYVATTGPTTVGALNSEYTGLYGIVTPYRVVANARLLDASQDVAAGVRQDFQLASIPVFQFAIFYSLDLEINPGPPMEVTGKVHGNAGLYTSPGTSLQFRDAVTAVGNIQHHRHPNDPQASSGLNPVYDAAHDSGVASLTLPIGSDNSPTVVREILDVPPLTEDPNSPKGRQRYYNKADLIVEVRTTGVTLKTGRWCYFSAIAQDTPGTGTGYSFIQTNTSFYNGREAKVIRPVDLDVAGLRTWLAVAGDGVNRNARTQLGHDLNSVYVDDQRVLVGAEQNAVRVLRGQTLPPAGLTVATRRPLYVQGHFNAPNTTPGSTDTSLTKPASLVGDSINVLSGAWSDYRSTQGLENRWAESTTINAALLGGIVESTAVNGYKYYSGGVENFPRFLENWDNRTLTYNGSMVVMFPSRFATGFWQQSSAYYRPPIRRWAFDSNFLQHHRLPPGTPQIRKLVRGQWAAVAPDVVN